MPAPVQARGPSRARFRKLALAWGACGLVAITGGLGIALSLRGEAAVRQLERARCAPLRILDRFGHVLRKLPGECAPYGRTSWTRLADVPPLVTRMLIASEDSRFERHAGVDVLAVARAARTNLHAGRVVSGASTLTMQLARMLESGEASSRSGLDAWWSKLSRAWTALAIEQRLSKSEILEAYVNLAYYGAGAYGIAAAARTYFGKSVDALSDAETSLLAVLPHAPGAYDLRRGLALARHRRDQVFATLARRGTLDAQTRTAILHTPIDLTRPRAATPAPAGHFVDYVLTELPTSSRRSGGELHTTLDHSLQTTLERVVAEHVASLADLGVDQAGVLVLDTDTGAIRAMVGSRAYDASQINITTRRRQLGSLLKPFVYALAIEAGESATSVALDVGDASPDYRTRDWVGREAGPLSYKEALAGSYNLAAIHVLERVGVPALHARLRKAGVAQLASAPDRYGLMLALGSARVRLLDVASGYGFLIRGGLTRPAHAIESLERADGSSWRPALPAERALFSETVSWQVMAMLSDAAARHRRFGLGLPLEAASPVAAKTGTASGLSDLSAILATREYIVAAWAGRFDGQPTRDTSGMWAAAPLASRALIAALSGRQPTLPPRPTEVATAAARDVTPTAQAAPPPPELEPWAERARVLANRKRATEPR